MSLPRNRLTGKIRRADLRLSSDGKPNERDAAVESRGEDGAMWFMLLSLLTSLLWDRQRPIRGSHVGDRTAGLIPKTWSTATTRPASGMSLVRSGQRGRSCCRQYIVAPRVNTQLHLVKGQAVPTPDVGATEDCHFPPPTDVGLRVSALTPHDPLLCLPLT